MARNTVTNEVVKEQDLAGGRFSLAQRSLAQHQAGVLANKMSARTDTIWVGFVKEYTPSQRFSS